MTFSCCNYYKFVGVLLINVVLFAVVAALGHILYEENDDVMMCMIANGDMTGSPDCHLVFINALLGSVFSSLYTLYSIIEWYAVSFTILHVISMSIIVYSIITEKNNDIKLKVLFLFVLYLLWFTSVISIQFTTTAAITCMAGCVLMLRNKMCYQTIGGILVLIASFVRFESAVLVGILFLPQIVLCNGANYKNYIKYIVLLVFVFLGVYANKAFYNNQAWSYYKAYNHIRATINDNPNAKKIDKYILAENNINEEDYNSLLAFFPDPEVITLSVLSNLSNGVNKVPFEQKIKNIQQLNQYRVLIILLILIAIIMVIGQEKKGNKRSVGAMCIIAISVLIIISLERYLKPRVFISLLIPMVTMYAMQSVKNSKKIIIPLYILIGLMAAKCGKMVYQRYMRNQAAIQFYTQEQLPLLSQLPAKSVVAFWENVNLEAISPFALKGECPVKIYPRGWMTYFPLHEGVDIFSHKNLLNENTYIFTQKEDVELKTIRNQLRKHYGIETKVTVVVQNRKYAIVKIKHYTYDPL